MDYALIGVLPKVSELDKALVEKWYDDFQNLMEIGKVVDDEMKYRLAYLVSDGAARDEIKKLRDNNTGYPSLQQIRDALLKVNTLTEIETYDKIKDITISPKQTITEFNEEYLGLYNQVSDNLKNGIKVSDYLKSISNRREACYAVLYDGASTIEEACTSAEKIQRVQDYEKLRSDLKDSNSKPFARNPPRRNPHDPIQDPDPSTTIRKFPFPGPFRAPTSGNERSKYVPVLNNTSNSATIICYRCGEEGHKGYRCPYNDEQLVKLLNDRLKLKRDPERSDNQKN